MRWQHWTGFGADVLTATNNNVSRMPPILSPKQEEEEHLWEGTVAMDHHNEVLSTCHPICFVLIYLLGESLQSYRRATDRVYIAVQNCDWYSVAMSGPTSSGKTLLLKKLQNPKSVDNTTSTVPTVGTNLITIKNDEKDKTICVRELGGKIAPLWPKYFANVRKVLYVVDTSNLCQISAAGVLLYSILSNPMLSNAKFLIILTKMDVSYRQMRNEALLMLQSKRLQKEITQNITITEASGISGEGREAILNWLFDKKKVEEAIPKIK